MELKSYAPPTSEVVEVFTEGVFCLSGEHSIENWKEQEFQW